MGVGSEVLRERYGDVSAKYATRAAISPLFAVSYMEKVGGMIDDLAEPTLTRCAACGKGGVPLFACSKCKRAKYLLERLSSEGLENAQEQLCT
ncbi:hypothetical protein F5141DRAFT_1138879, partial [Pisolithus sp. B1]